MLPSADVDAARVGWGGGARPDSLKTRQLCCRGMHVERAGTEISAPPPSFSFPIVQGELELPPERLSGEILRPVFYITVLSAAFPRVAKLESRCGE